MTSVEAALAHRWTAAEREAEARVDQRADVIGSPESVRERLEELVEATQADAVIVTCNLPDRAERRAAFDRLASAVALVAR